MFTTKCFTCKEVVGEGPDCSVCKSKFHFSCVGLSERGYNRLNRIGTGKDSWKCPSCRDPSAAIGEEIRDGDPRVESQATNTPSKKTFLSEVPPGSSILKENSKAKTNAGEYKDVTLSDISDKISQLFEKFSVVDTIQADLKEVKIDLVVLKSTLDSKFLEVSDKINNIETRVSQLECSKTELESLKSQVSDLIESSRKNEQWVRRSNIQINGVPQRSNENLLQIVKTLAKKSGFALNIDTDIDFVTRVAVKNDADTKKPKPIVLKMQSRYKKDEFIAALRKLKDLRTSDLGYADENNNRIFINDHLSTYNKALLQQAKILAKEKNYAFCWVRNCTVMVRRTNSSPVLFINSEDALKKISLVSLAFTGSIGMTFVILACALPTFNKKWWPFFVVLFYILSPIPTMIARRHTDATGGTSSSCMETAIFITMGFIISSFGLPIVLARATAIAWGACYLTLAGNVIVFLTILGFFTIFDLDDNDYAMW